MSSLSEAIDASVGILGKLARHDLVLRVGWQGASHGTHLRPTRLMP